MYQMLHNYYSSVHLTSYKSRAKSYGTYIIYIYQDLNDVQFLQSSRLSELPTCYTKIENFVTFIICNYCEFRK